MHSQLPTLDAVHEVLLGLAARPPLDDGMPAFLFRGERADYQSTLSTLDRYCRQYGLFSNVYEDLDDVAEYAIVHAVSGWDLHPREAAAFCQHYGLPTQMFDFTLSPHVATFFAANRSEHQARAPWGRIAVLDVARARSRSCAIFDLRQFAMALRPRRQHGFGMMLAYFGEDDIPDLKDPSLANDVGLQWLEFAHLPDDESFLYVIGAEANLLDLQGDSGARLPQDLVDEFVVAQRRLGEEAARLLSHEIPAIGRSPEDSYWRWSGAQR